MEKLTHHEINRRQTLLDAEMTAAAANAKGDSKPVEVVMPDPEDTKLISDAIQKKYHGDPHSGNENNKAVTERVSGTGSEAAPKKGGKAKDAAKPPVWNSGN